MGAPGCPTPHKKGYRRPEAARRHLWSLLRNKAGRRDWQTLHIYRCPCHLWHVGHERTYR